MKNWLSCSFFSILQQLTVEVALRVKDAVPVDSTLKILVEVFAGDPLSAPVGFNQEYTFTVSFAM